jgi:hypothetical protein
MAHFAIKFNHGVEIGARLAYLGHYERTHDRRILEIADEEACHRRVLRRILTSHADEPSKVIDGIFWCIGKSIGWFCRYAPLWSLNLVAKILEAVAVFSYSRLAKKYAFYQLEFELMAAAEKKHQEFFAQLK